MEQGLLCGWGSLQKNLAAVFWTMGQQLLLVWKKKQWETWEEVWGRFHGTYMQGIVGHPHQIFSLA